MSFNFGGESQQRTRQEPAVEVDDPNDWQKMQRLREIADAKKTFKEALARAREAQTMNDPLADPAIQVAHGALVDYIQELIPKIEAAMNNDGLDLAYNYWDEGYLGRLDVPHPPFQFNLRPDKVSGTRTVIEVRTLEGSTEFVGLQSIVDSPPTVPVEFVYETSEMRSEPTDSFVKEFPIPLRVIQQGGNYIERFRDEIGLDLEFKGRPYYSTEPGL